MSLDTGTLTGTNIPSIAARNVERDLKTFLDAVQVAAEAFFVARNISASFYADGVGTSLALSSDAVALISPISEGSTADGFPEAWWTAEEDRLNESVMTEFPEDPTPIIAVGHA